MKYVAFCAAVLLVPASLLAGEITGSVTFSHARGNANAVVYLDAAPGLKVTLPTRDPVMNQMNMHFVPHVLPVVVGSTVKFENSDDVQHNVFTPSPAGDMFNLGTWGKGGVKTHTFEKTGEVVLLCSLHPEMEGYIFVAPNPYFALTAGDGSYALRNVPAGSYTVMVWTESGNARPQKIDVPASGSVHVDFTIH